jgi:anti-sigma regulatory factor (Ser/Thr protein kinase)
VTPEPDPSSGREPARLVFALRADNALVARVARDRVEAWLARQRWPVEESHDIVYAVSEAVTNVCEHAYHRQNVGTVEVEAHVEHPTAQTRRVQVAVTDEGLWQQRAVRPFTRGRGLRVIRTLMAGVRLRRGTNSEPGTSLLLTSPPVPR